MVGDVTECPVCSSLIPVERAEALGLPVARQTVDLPEPVQHDEPNYTDGDLLAGP